jgi:hypothetical protein
VDGTRRPIYLDAKGPYVLDDNGERVYGVWLIPEEECVDLPVIVDEKFAMAPDRLPRFDFRSKLPR